MMLFPSMRVVNKKSFVFLDEQKPLLEAVRNARIFRMFLFLLMIFLSATFLMEAHAAPPLKYWYLGWNGSTYARELASRAEVCEATSAEVPSFINPRPNDADWLKETLMRNIGCIFNLQNNPTQEDLRWPGVAYCGVSLNAPSYYYVDKATETCYCPSGTVEAPEKNSCFQKTPVPQSSAQGNDSANLGPCPTCVGKPINPTNGNMWHIETDYVSAAPTSGLEMTRVYNSTPLNWDATVARSFGLRWTQRYDVVLKPEQAFTSGISPGQCWMRSDTNSVYCENPPAAIASPIPAAVSILRGDGKKYLFNHVGAAWIGNANTNDRVTAIYNADNTAVEGWVYVSAQGDTTERYDAKGRLTVIIARSGATQQLTYSNGVTNDTNAGRIPADAPVCGQIHPGVLQPPGRLLCVTDQASHQLQFEYDAKGRIITMLDPANQPYTYEYDGASAGCSPDDPVSIACTANNLTKVTYPDGKTHTYYYNEAAQVNGGVACYGAIQVGNGLAHLPNSWTGLIDENGVRHISWIYTCGGRASSSQIGAGVEKVVLDYTNIAAPVVTHYVGTPENPQTTSATFNVTQVLGLAKTSTISARCAECGDVAARTYDANGNLASSQDWNGNYTCYAYDLTRNLETARIEGTTSAACASLLTASSLTAPVRKISTQWHTGYRLPLVIAEPKKRTTYSYDTSGNLLSTTEQATSDETGAQGFAAAPVGTARTHSYTFDALGQPLTAKGPRTDVDDTVTYGYDSQNNLASVTNAAKQKTTLDNYDANGRVGRVVTPSGVVTEFTYTPRGWLASRTVTADGVVERTGYDYDGAGQLTRVTLPDGASVAYTYDDAHRLTGVADSLGNSVAYTLDLRGNRIKEQVNDPTGALARQTSRVYDTLNRLQQQTGAIQ